MPDAMDRLETKVRELIRTVDDVSEENRTYRTMLAGTRGTRMSRGEVIEELEGLRQEKLRLERKLERVREGLGQVLVELEKLEL